MHFIYGNICISTQIVLKCVPMGRVYNKSALVHVMAWHRAGSRPLLSWHFGSGWCENSSLISVNIGVDDGLLPVWRHAIPKPMVPCFEMDHKEYNLLKLKFKIYISIPTNSLEINWKLPYVTSDHACSDAVCTMSFSGRFLIITSEIWFDFPPILKTENEAQLSCSLRLYVKVFIHEHWNVIQWDLVYHYRLWTIGRQTVIKGTPTKTRPSCVRTRLICHWNRLRRSLPSFRPPSRTPER